MILQPPSVILEAGLTELSIKYKWNDKDPFDAYGFESPRLQNKIAKISKRGIIAISASITEWMAWRFSNYDDSKELIFLLEAVWASSVDFNYIDLNGKALKGFKWTAWKGNIRGPICAAAKKLIDIVETAKIGNPIAFKTVGLFNVTMLVVNNNKVFKEWMKTSIINLLEQFPVDKKEPLGIAVPRQCLFDENIKNSNKLIDDYLKSLDYTKNPYLQTPQNMKKAGFVGTPYSYS